jgi:hypothetical protein
MGSIFAALYAGCKPAMTDTIITVADMKAISDGFILAARTRLECCAKLKVIPAFLDTRLTVFYSQSMGKYLSLLVAAMLVFAGFGSVPRCYVMKPDCSASGTLQCPLTQSETVTTEKGCNSCPHLVQKSARQQRHTIPPFDRLARFSIDQDRQSSDLSPDCVPIVALVQNSQLLFVEPINDKEIFPARLTSLPDPPLLILLQKQSFLI